MSITFFRDQKRTSFAERPAGVVSLIGWERLALLLDKHECTPSERVTHLEATPDGIYIVFGQKT